MDDNITCPPMKLGPTYFDMNNLRTCIEETAEFIALESSEYRLDQPQRSSKNHHSGLPHRLTLIPLYAQLGIALI